MNEEEKQIVEDYKSDLALYKYERKIGLGRINIDEKIYEMEVIINVIERLQKENEEYSKQLDLDYIDKNYISKKKIEDTIEKLKKMNIDGDVFRTSVNYAILMLQKLLESEN
nr:MAG TPA: hypothetical protein [Caudoviricetes sp.]